jgi:hypothetical protein
MLVVREYYTVRCEKQNKQGKAEQKETRQDLFNVPVEPSRQHGRHCMSADEPK